MGVCYVNPGARTGTGPGPPEFARIWIAGYVLPGQRLQYGYGLTALKPTDHGFTFFATGLESDTQTHTVLKIVFENRTAGTKLGLFAGTNAEFTSGAGGLQLSDSGGPGFQFLSIIDTNKLSGKILFVRREVGSADSQFALTVE